MLDKSTNQQSGSTSSAEAFHARVFPAQVSEEDSAMNVPDSGPNMSGSFAYYDRTQSLWRTSPDFSIVESTEFSGTWPTSGSMRNGMCSHQPQLEQDTDEDDSIYWPTPTASMGKSGWGVGKEDKNRYRREVRMRCNRYGWHPGARFLLWMMGYPESWLDCLAIPLTSESPKKRGKL